MRSSSNISIRPASIEDTKNVFEWRNDPWLVPFSSTQKKVTWGEHEPWFVNSLKNQDIAIFIIEFDGIGGGQIRFSYEGDNKCIISISMLKPYTGRGNGVNALKMGCTAICKKWTINTIYAYIRNDNINSISAFEKAEFVKNSTITPPENHVCLTREVKNDE